MSPTCYVHVGLPKTGTSYLQRCTRRSREELAHQGLDLLFPDGYDALFLSLHLRDRLSPDLDPPHAFTAVERLTVAATASRGDRALLSQEMLGGARPERIPALRTALSKFDVEVIVTMRDLASYMTSSWQQVVKSRGMVTFHDFLDEFVTGRIRLRPAADVHYVLETWSAQVPAQKLHIVTLPRPGEGRRVLLERFCSVLGVDAARIDAPTENANESLGAVQAELLRRVNVDLGDRLPHRRAGYSEQGKNFLAKEILRPQSGERARIPKSLAGWCMEESERLIASISEHGFPVAGDLDDLRPDPTAISDDDEFVSVDNLLDSSTQALAAMLAERSELTKEVRQLRRELREARNRVDQPPAPKLTRALRDKALTRLRRPPSRSR